MKSFHSVSIAQRWVTEESAQREEIKCYMGCEPDVNPQLQKGTGKPIITCSSVEAGSSLSPNASTRTPSAYFQGPRFNPSSSRKCRSRKIEMTWVLLYPRGGVMQMQKALRFVPVSVHRGIYANVQNGWSELVIHESSKENESLDTATLTRLLPAFWMTSCLFIPLDCPPPFTFYVSPFPFLFLFFIHFLLTSFPHSLAPSLPYTSFCNPLSLCSLSPLLQPF